MVYIDDVLKKLCNAILSEDSVHVSGDYGIMSLAVRKDANAALGADGDYTPLQTDANGFLKVTISGAPIVVSVNLDLADDEAMIGVTSDGGTTRTLAMGGIVGTKATTEVLGMIDNIGYGQFLTTPPTITDTQLHNLTMDNRAGLRVTATSAGANISAVVSNADAVAASSLATKYEVVARETAFNGTTFDRVRTIEGATADTGILATVDKPSTSANAAASLAQSTALEASRVIKASAGNLIEIQGFTTTAQFIQVHNTTSVPANGVVPILSFAVEANKNFYKAFKFPVRFSTGITVCNSTAQATKTLGGSDVWFEVQYM